MTLGDGWVDSRPADEKDDDEDSDSLYLRLKRHHPASPPVSDAEEPVVRRRLKKLRTADCDSDTAPAAPTPTTTNKVELLPKKGESDYLEFRRVTAQIKKYIIDALAGPDDDQARATIADCIQRGRCAFMHSYQPPASIENDNPNLKPYQVAAIHWLLTLYKNNLNGLVADDMGLGKSAECICFLKRLYSDGLLDLPTVVACPATLLDNWCDEFQKWAPRLRVLKYHGSQTERRNLMRKFETGFSSASGSDDESESQHSDQENGGQQHNSNRDHHPAAEEESTEMPSERENNQETGATMQDLVPSNSEELINENESYPLPSKCECAYHIVVTTYQTLANVFDRQQFFKPNEFGYLVVDEAHSLKNAGSRRYQQMNKSIGAPNRLLLTGSPVQNQISELKNLLAFLNPYRQATFDIESALRFHTRVWRHALEQGKLTNSNELPTDVSSPPPSAVSTSPPSTQKSPSRTSGTPPDDASSRETAAGTPPSSLGLGAACNETDPEILFYQQLLAPLILRRLKAEVIENFPKKTNKIELCDMVPAQKALYEEEVLAAKPLLADVPVSGRKQRKTKSSSENKIPPTTATFIKGLLFRLRRICNHPLLHQKYFSAEQRNDFASFLRKNSNSYKAYSQDQVVKSMGTWSDFDIHCEAAAYLPLAKNFRLPPEELLKSCKILRMLELLDEICLRKDQKVLIFSQFTTFLNVIQETLSTHRPHLPFLRLDGTTAVDDRSSMVSAFQSTDGDYRVFLLSTKAGGVGINLTSAQTVILMDQDWNPHNDRQAEDRVHRLGQTGDVTIYRLCCRFSFEETVLSCCKKKLELDEAFGGNVETSQLEIFEDIIRTVKTSTIVVSKPEDEDAASTSSTVQTKGSELAEDAKEAANDQEDENKEGDSLKKAKTEPASNKGAKGKQGTTRKAKESASTGDSKEAAVKDGDGCDEDESPLRSTRSSSNRRSAAAPESKRSRVTEKASKSSTPYRATVRSCRRTTSKEASTNGSEQKANQSSTQKSSGSSVNKKSSAENSKKKGPTAAVLLPGWDSDDEKENPKVA